MVKTPLLHPGHTGTGAIVGPHVEKEHNEAMTLQIAVALRDIGKPGQVIEGRTSAIRRASCIGLGGISVEVHHNTGKGNASLVFYRRGSVVGRQTAESIVRELASVVPWWCAAFPSDSDGYPNVKAALHWTEPTSSPPGILIECCFLDNPGQMEWLDTHAREFANAVARGLCA